MLNLVDDLRILFITQNFQRYGELGNMIRGDIFTLINKKMEKLFDFL